MIFQIAQAADKFNNLSQKFKRNDKFNNLYAKISSTKRGTSDNLARGRRAPNTQAKDKFSNLYAKIQANDKVWANRPQMIRSMQKFS